MKQWPDRVWAVEGANGAGRPLAQRLVAAGEQVVDVPAKLAARVRLFDTGHNRKTDALDAHSIAVVAVRTDGLRVVVEDGELEALRMLTDRRDELAHQRVQTVNRLQRLLSELLPGQRKRDLSATQAKAMLATVRPRDIAGKTRRRMAAEEIADLVAVDAKLKKIKAELKAAVLERGSTLMDLYGVGPAGAARVLADVGDVARFADRNRFASWTGTAPLDASSGEQTRHRLVTCGEPADEPRPARRGDRADPPRHRRPRLLPAQARRRQDTDGSTAVPEAAPVRRRLPPARRRRPAQQDGAGPGGHCGATLQSSAADSHPLIDTSDQPLPGPAKPTLRRPPASRKTLIPSRSLTQRGARSGCAKRAPRVGQLNDRAQRGTSTQFPSRLCRRRSDRTVPSSFGSN